MRHTCALIVTFAAGAAGLYAQQPPPVDLFSPATIRSYTPADNPVTDAKAKLGDMIFDEKRLSADNTIACNVCHSPRNGFTTHTPASRGVSDQIGKRNAPSILNAMFYKTQFWDGRAASLEEQALMPILNPIEMGQKSPADVVAKLSAIPEFVDAFQKVFGHPVNWEDIGKAVAAFERTRISTEAPLDRFLKGDEKAMNAAQKRGWALFTGKARCTTCHTYDPALPLFGDNRFHNTGLSVRNRDFGQLAKRAAAAGGNKEEIDRLALETEASELGRFLVTKEPADIGSFKTPFLRDVVMTGPYMHDGSLETLYDVVQFFNKGGEPNQYLDKEMKPLGLTQAEMDDLCSFMGALTSDRFAAQGGPELDRQHTAFLYRAALARASNQSPTGR